MRVALLDPRWREQRDRALEEKKRHEDPYAPGMTLTFTFTYFVGILVRIPLNLNYNGYLIVSCLSRF